MIPTTMRAVVLPEHGGLDKLQFTEQHPIRALAPHEVLIRVRACSLNYHDVFTCRGLPGIKVPLPVIPGNDIAGDVAALGAEVSGWQIGESVLVNPVYKGRGLMGEMLDGGLAEYAIVSNEQLIRLPEGVSYEEAAALPVAYGTAHRMMVSIGQMKPGERVLVLGASGGVGTGCVLLARQAGCEVIACASGEDKLARLRDLGADHVIDYTRSDFMKEIFARFGKPNFRNGEGGVDVVVNYTGGDTWVPSLRCLRKGGRVLVCGATAGFAPAEDLRFIWTFELKVLGSNGWTRDDLSQLMEGVRSGVMKPVIDRVLPLERGIEGLRLMEDRKLFGKIIIAP
jgi:NADPH:quinone reductase-like Zn-dependent oxidoreductase